MVKLCKRLWKILVFGIGDLKCPFVKGHLCDYDEASKGIKKIYPGYIGVHRDRGYLSNIFIPGFMKHGWIHESSATIIEAVSEGVLKRHALHAIRSDYVIILKPVGIRRQSRDKAIAKANKIVGCKYDSKFNFDIEKELHIFDEDVEGIEDNLIKRFDIGFSCTEVVLFAYFHVRKKLGLFRRKVFGKKVIIADDFLNHSFKIVWMSKSVTEEAALKYGLHEEGVEMIKEYWSKHEKN